MSTGFTGISFPFRIGNKGGVVMSSTNSIEVPHIIEAMQQVLLTRPLERGMEFHFKSEIDSNIFEINNISTHTLITYQIKEALRELEDRIEVLDVQITEEEEYIYATIFFKVLMYDTTYSTKLKVGESSVKNPNTSP